MSPFVAEELKTPRIQTPKLPQTDRQLTDLANRLQASFAALVKTEPAGRLSPAGVSARFGIERSLARRLVTALAESNPLLVMHRLPGVHGLRAVLEAARRKGAPAALLRTAGQAVEDFAQVIADAGGSQERFHSALSDYMPEIRRPTELRNRAAVYKGMVDLLGHSTRVLVCVKACQPSTRSPDLVDVMHIHAHFGLNKLRRMAPLVFAARGQSPSSQTEIETLDGRAPDERHPEWLLMTPWCNPPDPGVRWFDGALVLDTDTLVPSEPVDIVLGFMRRAGAYRTPRPGIAQEMIGYVVSHPARMLLLDCLVRDDLWTGITPRLETHRTGYRGGVEPESYAARWFDRLEHLETTQAIGRGLFNLDVPEVPQLRQIVAAAMESAGWDLTRFAGYRTQIVYPVLERQVSMVFPLQLDQPASAQA